MKKIIFAAIVSTMLAACANTPMQDEQNGAKVEDRSQGTQAKPVDSASVAAAALKDPNNILSKRSVYFDFDDFTVKDTYRSLLQSHAKFLSDNQGYKILIQGNADERGSREYNLALGQKRAEAVKKMLVLLGASDGQVESVSLGEEKPKAPGHDEAAWAENRRADILYSGEY